MVSRVELLLSVQPLQEFRLVREAVQERLLQQSAGAGGSPPEPLVVLLLEDGAVLLPAQFVGDRDLAAHVKYQQVLAAAHPHPH